MRTSFQKSLSKWSKVSLSMNRAAISEPTPCWGHPSSSFTILFVFVTDLMIAGLSNGFSDLRLITSQSISCSDFKILAASSENSTILAKTVIVTSFPFLSMFAFPIGSVEFDKKIHLLGGQFELLVIHHLTFEEDNGIIVHDGCSQQSKIVRSIPWYNNLEARARSIPCTEALGVLGCNSSSYTIDAFKDNWASQITIRHVMGFGAGVDDVIDQLHGEVPGPTLMRTQFR